MKPSDLAKAIVSRSKEAGKYIVAIAGPPASGKSTLAENLLENIASIAPELNAVMVPMDGFHLDNEKLDQMKLRHRKGAPETFDAEGFVDMMKSIHANEKAVSVPGFDRKLDRVVDGNRTVTRENRLILVEGNYLLLNEKPWNALHPLFDETIFINPGIQTIEARLVQRWLDHDHTPQQARDRAMTNDIPNARTVITGSRKADLLIDTS